jgi:hypothetical protein
MYSEAPEVAQLAETVIDELGPDYLPDVYGQPIQIHYLFKNSKKSQYLGKCSKATGKWKHMVGKDFIIECWSPWWNSASDNEKQALLYHELRHIKLEEKEDESGNIEINWKIRKHFVEMFTEEISLFGMWRPEIEEVVKVSHSWGSQNGL